MNEQQNTQDALTEAQVNALYTRGMIDRATWEHVLRVFRGDPNPAGLHAVTTCSLAVAALVETAVNAACKVIQDRLGVKTGDLAATVLSGGAIERELIRYVHAELATMAGDDDPPAAAPEGAP